MPIDFFKDSERSEWITKADYARYRGVCRRTIDNWIARRLIPTFKMGRVVRLNRKSCDEALARFERSDRDYRQSGG